MDNMAGNSAQSAQGQSLSNAQSPQGQQGLQGQQGQYSQQGQQAQQGQPQDITQPWAKDFGGFKTEMQEFISSQLNNHISQINGMLSPQQQQQQQQEAQGQQYLTAQQFQQMLESHTTFQSIAQNKKQLADAYKSNPEYAEYSETINSILGRFGFDNETIGYLKPDDLAYTLSLAKALKQVAGGQPAQQLPGGIRNGINNAQPQQQGKPEDISFFNDFKAKTGFAGTFEEWSSAI